MVIDDIFEKTEKRFNNLPDIADIWANPFGKIALTIVGFVSLFGFGSLFMKVGAIAVHAFKDLRDAWKR
jgi:hypothetical protein